MTEIRKQGTLTIELADGELTITTDEGEKLNLGILHDNNALWMWTTVGRVTRDWMHAWKLKLQSPDPPRRPSLSLDDLDLDI